MTTYTLEEWAVQPFPNTFTNVAMTIGFPRPELAVAGADGLLCYDRNAGTASLYATVQQGQLDNGIQVQNGAFQIGVPQTFDRLWSQIIPGVFGKSGALLLFYDATTGVGEFYGIAGKNGPLTLIKRNTGWRTSWTHILSGKFSGDDGDQLLFYDASAGVGEFYSVDQTGSIHLIKTNTGWRGSWFSIIAGKFSDNKFSDLVFYDKSAGTGEFWHTDGHGGIALFSTHTDWRRTWRGVNAGYFAANNPNAYSGLLFYEDGTGDTEFFATDGKGGISLLPMTLGSVWPSRAANWQTVLVAAGYTGTTGTAGLTSLVGYDPAHGNICYFYINIGNSANKTVPDVQGESQAQAKQDVEAQGLVAAFAGAGTWVSKQSPAAGTLVDAGTKVTMTLSSGKQP